MAKRTSTPVDAPSAGDILGLYTLRLNEGDEAKLRSRARRARELTEMEHAVVIPPQYLGLNRQVQPLLSDVLEKLPLLRTGQLAVFTLLDG